MTQSAHFREGMWTVSPYNHEAEVNAGKHMPKKVQITDLILREQKQVDGVSLALD